MWYNWLDHMMDKVKAVSKTQLYIVIDIETTGLDPRRDKLIEVGAVKIKRGLVIEEYATLINPERMIRPEITELTSIDDEMVAKAPVYRDVLPDLRAFLEDGILIAHNASFEESFLGQDLPDHEFLDSLALAQIAFPAQNSYSLENLVRSLALGSYDAHRALEDARMTAKLFTLCLQTLDSFKPQLKANLHSISRDIQNPLARLIRERTEAASRDEDKLILEPQGRLGKNKAREGEISESYELDVEEMAEYFKPGGYCEKRLPGFESRPQQFTMCQEVARAFKSKNFLLAEAGTGTGKSLAYLLPAAIFAKKSGKQVAVSTHTINLQEQLLEKDIPMLRQALGQDLKAAVLKGRGNYLCLSLYRSYINQGEERHLVFLSRLAVWLSRSEKGDGNELNLNSRERWQWNMLSASRENCLAPFCRNANQACFVARSRQDAENADIFILNHSLLLANATLEKSILPPLPYLIIDEAHHLEKTAESQFAQSLDFYDILYQLGRLQRLERKKQSGLLPRLKKDLAGFFENPDEQAKAEGKIALLETALAKTVEAGSEFFKALQASYLEDAQKSGYFPATLRIDYNLREEERWFAAENMGEIFSSELKHLSRLLYRLWEELSLAENDHPQHKRLESKDFLKGIDANLKMSSDNLTEMFKGTEGFVVWLEFPKEDKCPSLQMAPLALGEALHSTIFQEKEAVILTSATLTAEKGSFKFYKERTGLDLLDVAPRELVLPSPFDYKSKALLAYCTDIPDPSSHSEIHFTDAVAKAIFQLVKASKGRAVVLFTSHAQLKAVYNELRRPLAKEGVSLLAHGISGNPTSLLERLRSEGNCCILGANSFWEGIDVSGSALSLVIVVRLPFWPPNTPIMQERIEKIEAQGLNSFKSYSLPQAIIRFKQGFGRLIRTQEDKGVFCVLDCRVYSKFYGRSFEKALPEMSKLAADSPSLALKIAEWLD